MGFPTEVTEEKCKIILGIKSSNRGYLPSGPNPEIGALLPVGEAPVTWSSQRESHHPQERPV